MVVIIMGYCIYLENEDFLLFSLKIHIIFKIPIRKNRQQYSRSYEFIQIMKIFCFQFRNYYLLCLSKWLEIV